MLSDPIPLNPASPLLKPSARPEHYACCSCRDLRARRREIKRRGNQRQRVRLRSRLSGPMQPIKSADGWPPSRTKRILQLMGSATLRESGTRRRREVRHWSALSQPAAARRSGGAPAGRRHSGFEDALPAPFSAGQHCVAPVCLYLDGTLGSQLPTSPSYNRGGATGKRTWLPLPAGVGWCGSGSTHHSLQMPVTAELDLGALRRLVSDGRLALLTGMSVFSLPC